MRLHGISAHGAPAALALFCAALVVGSMGAAGQGQPSAPPAAKAAKAAAKKSPAPTPATAEAAQTSIDAGVAAYNAGKTDQAVANLTSALSGGKLPAAQMARALYYRGIAYRKQAKPAQAIADLTSALWLKNGLAASERADATAQRSAAYREAGLPDQTDGSTAPKPTPAAIAQPAPAPKTPQSAAVATPAPSPTIKSQPAAPIAAAAPPATVKTAALAPSPQAAPPSQSTSGGYGGFFANLFGGGSSTPAEVKPPQPKPLPAQPQTSGWSEQVQVKRTQPTAPTATAALPQAAPAAPAAPRLPAPGAARAPVPVPAVAAEPPARGTDPYAIHQRASTGRFQLQVAAVRTRAEAQAIYDRLRQQHAKDPGFREAIIDETAIGGMGTFYRVRLGPYAEANEPRTLCTKLRTSGVDCLIVAP